MTHHVATDPACRHFKRPRTIVERWVFDRARGRPCSVCAHPSAEAVSEIDGRRS